MKRRSEVFESILELSTQARAACGALVRGGWRGKPFWEVQLHHARGRLQALFASVVENRLFLPRDLESKLLRLHDRLVEACADFDRATKMGKNSIQAHEAMVRARNTITEEGSRLETGIERRMMSILSNREDIFCLGS